MKRSGAGEAHDDATFLTSGGSAGGRDRPLDLIENGPGAIQEGAARVGEFHAARLPAEQLGIELFLQRPDLHTQGWLLNAQPFGRPGHVLFFSYSNEVAQVSQFHDEILIRYR